MKRALLSILIAFAVWEMAGCGSPKPIKYYAVHVPSAPSPNRPIYPVDLVVARLGAAELLEASPIVYKTGANEVGTYAYHRWTQPPVEMVQEKMIRMLRTSGEFRNIIGVDNRTGSGPSALGSLVLRGRLYEFAEVDGPEIGTLVTMEFELYNRAVSKILWTHYYSGTEPVAAPAKKVTVPKVVQALDQNLDRGLNEVAGELRKYLAANPPDKS
jgi:ABC-type uncharacterized transport system auxiliary subunit